MVICAAVQPPAKQKEHNTQNPLRSTSKSEFNALGDINTSKNKSRALNRLKIGKSYKSDLNKKGSTLQPCIDAFHQFYLAKKEVKPTWGAAQCATLKRIIANIEKVYKQRHPDDTWDTNTCVEQFNIFLQLAWDKDDWTRIHFTIFTLSSQFDNIITYKKTKRYDRTNKPNATSNFNSNAFYAYLSSKEKGQSDTG